MLTTEDAGAEFEYWKTRDSSSPVVLILPPWRRPRLPNNLACILSTHHEDCILYSAYRSGPRQGSPASDTELLPTKLVECLTNLARQQIMV